MLQEACPRCQSKNFVKAGKDRQKQRFKCKDCGRLFLETNDQSYSPEIRQQTLKLVLEGLGFRSIERILGVSHVSVMNWVKEAGLKAMADLKNKQVEAEMIELDELCTYVQKKTKNAGCGWLLTVSPVESLASHSAIVVSPVQ